jgi:hypothetical protein
MNRIVSTLSALLLAITASAADRFSPDPEQITIATTGRIMKLDIKNKTLKVRGSDPGMASVTQTQGTSLIQRLGLSFPRSIRIDLPGLNGKRPPKATPESENSLEEYTVIVTDDTLIQDGSDPIRLEDFKVGETISIHGVLRGKTLTASRVAKWS